jgi:hypothetical protein
MQQVQQIESSERDSWDQWQATEEQIKDKYRYYARSKKIFNPEEKIKEYQQNCFENILRMPTCHIPHMLITTLKEKERDANHWRDGKMNLPNPEIGTGQKA